MSSPTIPQGAVSIPSLAETYGAVLISTFVAFGLYGISLSQVFRYYRLYQGDPLFLKGLIMAIFFADSFHTVALAHISYHYLVRNYANPIALGMGVWSIQIMSVSTGLVVVLVHSFYARRLYLINGRYRWAVAVVGCLILTEIGMMIAATYFALKSVAFVDFAPYLWLDSALFCIATATDLVLMIIFVIVLRRSRTSFQGTRGALDSLSLYAVLATLLNTMLTLPAFITSVTSTTSFLYIALAIPTTKVYSNSVLAVLNCRASLAQSLGPSTDSTSISLTTFKRTRRNRAATPIGSYQSSHPRTASGTTPDVKRSGRSVMSHLQHTEGVILIGESSCTESSKDRTMSLEV